MVNDQEDVEKIAAELKGKTLLVYWYFLKHGGGPKGVREIQRALKFSSPSVALYHLEKLRNLGLIKKNETGDYSLINEVKVGMLKLFVRLGKLMLPRFLFYAVFMTTMLAGYVILYPQMLTPDNFVALLFGSVSSAIMWYETIKVLRQSPF